MKWWNSGSLPPAFPAFKSYNRKNMGRARGPSTLKFTPDSLARSGISSQELHIHKLGLQVQNCLALVVVHLSCESHGYFSGVGPPTWRIHMKRQHTQRKHTQYSFRANTLKRTRSEVRHVPAIAGPPTFWRASLPLCKSFYWLYALIRGSQWASGSLGSGSWAAAVLQQKVVLRSTATPARQILVYAFSRNECVGVFWEPYGSHYSYPGCLWLRPRSASKSRGQTRSRWPFVLQHRHQCRGLNVRARKLQPLFRSKHEIVYGDSTRIQMFESVWRGHTGSAEFQWTYLERCISTPLTKHSLCIM